MTIQQKCLSLYETGGQWAVINYCLSIKWKYWAECPPCECQVPVDPKDGSCLVCSHTLEVDAAECQHCLWQGLDVDMETAQDQEGDPLKVCPECKSDDVFVDFEKEVF